MTTNIDRPTMRVARYYGNQNVRVEEAPRPTLDEGEALVRVACCGICGSDVMEWFRLPKAPRILGHELAGIVEQSRSNGLRPGDRVVIRNQVTCGQCHACRSGHHSVCEHSDEIEPGGMAEYVRLPAAVIERGVWQLPDGLPFRAAALAEPLACTLHSQALARIPGKRCLVLIGCGLFGLLHLRIARLASVERIIVVEPNEYRRRAAMEFGASIASDITANLAETVRSVNDGYLADASIIATGSPIGIETASTIMGRHGTILLFGMPGPQAPANIHVNRLFWRKELTVQSSYGPGNVPFSEPLRLMHEKSIDFNRLITHEFPLDEVQRGFDVTSKADASLKVVLNLWDPR